MRWTLTVVAVAAVVSSIAQANPTNPTVVNGSATFSTSAGTLTVTNSSNTIINWQGFSINTGETTRFNQPSTSSVVLNRVIGPDPSSIMGSLTSNGHVFLTNPNGIVFGASAQVNVAGLVASTLDISDANFVSGNLQFAASGPVGTVSNNGSLVASSGYVALIGPTIQSTGSISAGPGGIAIVAGDPATLSVAGGILTNASVGSNVSNASFDVRGPIDTTGPIFFYTNGNGYFNPGGNSLPPPIPIDTSPVAVCCIGSTPGGSGNISTATFNVAAATGRVSLVRGSAVTLQGSTLGSSTGSLVATGVTLNLEKREVSF